MYCLGTEVITKQLQTGIISESQLSSYVFHMLVCTLFVS